MSAAGKCNSPGWDHFFDDCAAHVKDMTCEEVEGELKRRGLDVSSAISRVNRALASAVAKEELKTARLRRPCIVEKLSGIVAPRIECLRERVEEMISGRLKGTLQAAYFRKLEHTAGDDDMQSLMDDIERLDALMNDDESHFAT
jgi:hypothetical protein